MAIIYLIIFWQLNGRTFIRILCRRKAHFDSGGFFMAQQQSIY